MWASKTEVGHRTAFLCKHCCSERHSCTEKKKKREKKSSLFWEDRIRWSICQAGSGGCYGDGAADRHWREHHYVSWFAGLIDQLKLYRELWLPRNRQLGSEMLFTLLTNSRSIPLSLGLGLEEDCLATPPAVTGSHELWKRTLDFLLNEAQNLISGSSDA